jgi:putative ABC transport system permease protein
MAGMLMGGVAAWQGTRRLGYLLYGVSPRDPAAFAAACGVIALAALTACAAPALRATRTDPVAAIRTAS